MVLGVEDHVVETEVNRGVRCKALRVVTAAERIENASGKLVETVEIEPADFQSLVTNVGHAIVTVIDTGLQGMVAGVVGDVIDKLKLPRSPPRGKRAGGHTESS